MKPGTKYATVTLVSSTLCFSPKTVDMRSSQLKFHSTGGSVGPYRWVVTARKRCVVIAARQWDPPQWPWICGTQQPGGGQHDAADPDERDGDVKQTVGEHGPVGHWLDDDATLDD